MRAKIDAQYHEMPDGIFTWHSSDRTVATVGADGDIETLDPGFSIITATCDGVSGSARLEVVPNVGQHTPAPLRTYALIQAGRITQYVKAAGVDALRLQHDVEEVRDMTDVTPKPALYSWVNGATFYRR